MISGQLAIMRTLIAGGMAPYFAAAKAGVDSRGEDVLAQVFTPATAAAHAAMEKWTKDPTDKNARAAIRLTQLSSAQLWGTIEAMPVPQLLKQLDRAILKAK